MTTVRASVSSVFDAVRAELRREAETAAGSNTLISRSEQGVLTDDVMQDAAEAVRAAGGPGTTVSVDALVEAAEARMSVLLGTVNQASGPGMSAVSQTEVKALFATHPAAAERLARAYEIVTGKPIVLDGVTPTPGPAPSTDLGDLNFLQETLSAYLREALRAEAGPNLLFNATERAALPSGLLRDGAFATPAPRTVDNVLTWIHNEVLVPALVAAGNQPTNLGTFDRVLPFSVENLTALVGIHPELAGLLADAVMVRTGTRPDVPGLPSVRFTSSDTRTVYERAANAARRAFGIDTLPGSPVERGHPPIIAHGHHSNGVNFVDIEFPGVAPGIVGRGTLGVDGGDDAFVDFEWVNHPAGAPVARSAAFDGLLDARLAALGLVDAVVLGGGMVEGGNKTYRIAVEDTDANGARRIRHLQLRGAHLGVLQIVPNTLFERDLLEVAKAVCLDHQLKAAHNIGPMGEAEVLIRSSTTNRVLDPADSPFGFDPQTEIHIGVSPRLGDMAVFVTFDKNTLELTRVEMT